ncbi:Fur family transcriptional regulator [Kineococcus terrestris]|uniref:Fur family transcriptional regulator n=1 Tax=Kineococcus terrestris TaxID=2044856 RepID=UPI0034DAEF7C
MTTTAADRGAPGSPGAPEERLRARGLRATRPRAVVLGVLDGAAATAEHLAVAQVVDRARRELPAVSVQAVYDCLDALTRAGLARRIEPAGHPARYEARVGDNHHHLVCRGCGRTADVDCTVGAAPCLLPDLGAPGLPAGFTVDEAEVVFWGRCADCAATGSPTTTTPRPAAGDAAETAEREEAR